MSPDITKMALTIVLGCGAAFIPLVLSNQKHRTKLLLFGFFGTFFVLPFFVPSVYTIYYEEYKLLKGITRGLDVFLTDFWLVALTVDRFVANSSQRKMTPTGTVPYAVLILVMALSVFDAQERYLVLFETLKFVKGAIAFWVFANIARTPKGVGDIIDAILYCFAAMIGAILIKKLGGDWRAMRVGFTNHKNVWALFINLFAPLIVALAFFNFQRVYYRWALLGGVFAFAFLNKVSESRGGQVCFALGIIVVTAFALLRRQSFSVNYKQMLTLYASILLGLVIFADDLSSRWRQGFNDQYSGIMDTRRAAMTERKEMREHCWQIIEEHPINGVGFSNYTYYWHQKGLYRTLAHHLYLLTAAETGWIGLLALLYFLFFWLFYAVKAARANLPPPLVAVATAMPAIFLIPMVHCLIEYNFREYLCFIAYSILAGLCSGLNSIAAQMNGSSPEFR